MPLPELGYRRVVPSLGLEPRPRGLRVRCAAARAPKGLELMPSIELGRRPYHGRMLPLHHISLERMVGVQPTPQGLEGLQACITPHSHWFGLRDSHPSLHGGAVVCGFHTQAEQRPAATPAY